MTQSVHHRHIVCRINFLQPDLSALSRSFFSSDPRLHLCVNISACYPRVGCITGDYRFTV